MLYCSWDMARGRCNCYFSFWTIFCPSTPLNSPKNKNLTKKKKKKKPGDVIILHKCTKNYNHMVYCSWYGVWHVIVIFYFGLFFALLPHNFPEKWKFKKNEKNTWRYCHFAQVYQKSWSYAILFLRCGTWQMLIFILGYFFPFYPPNSPKKSKFQNNEKIPKIMIRWCRVPEKWCTTDRRMEKVTHRGGSPT